MPRSGNERELAALTPGHYAEILQLRRESTDIFRQAVSCGIDEETFAAADVHRVVRAILSLGRREPSRPFRHQQSPAGTLGPRK